MQIFVVETAVKMSEDGPPRFVNYCLGLRSMAAVRNSDAQQKEDGPEVLPFLLEMTMGSSRALYLSPTLSLWLLCIGKQYSNGGCVCFICYDAFLCRGFF